MNHIVGVGDMKTGSGQDVLITHALGSCLGLLVYDPVAKIGGLLHAMLPLSSINPEKASTNPHMFVDTGVPVMFKTLFEMGAQRGRLVIKAAGCGQPLGNGEYFNIGDRNYTVLKKLLWKNNFLISAQDVGGTQSRTIHFYCATGELIISSKGEKTSL